MELTIYDKCCTLSPVRLSRNHVFPVQVSMKMYFHTQRNRISSSMVYFLIDLWVRLQYLFQIYEFNDKQAAEMLELALGSYERSTLCTSYSLRSPYANCLGHEHCSQRLGTFALFRSVNCDFV